jgi:hypothetical protein
MPALILTGVNPALPNKNTFLISGMSDGHMAMAIAEFIFLSKANN